MKKIICILLVFVCCAALFAGCKPQTPPDGPAAEPSSGNTAADGQDLEAFLKDLTARYPDDTAAALAGRILENPYYKLFVQETPDLQGEFTYFPALNESFTGEGLKEASCVWDAFDSRAFIYVFTPAEGADAQTILAAAKNAVDPYWSEEPFENELLLTAGGKAFFALYNGGMEPVTGMIAAKARDFTEMFHAYLKDHPDAPVLEIAEYLASHQKITSMCAYTAVPGVLTGFGDFEHETEITGFAQGASLIPEISPNPFIGYLFRLEDGADVDAFMKELAEKANLAWNVCIVTDTVITEADGNTVLFMMCSEETR